MKYDPTKLSEGKCAVCDSKSRHLQSIDLPGKVEFDDYAMHGVGMISQWVCVRCAMDWGVTEPVSFDAEDYKFSLRKFFGGIATGAVETVFEAFDYAVYPFGYENLLGGAIKALRTRSTEPAIKLRSIPDLLIVGPPPSR